jgi:hypothetical protein
VKLWENWIDVLQCNVKLHEIIKQGVPEQARNMMGMLGFRITINLHGEVIKLDQPAIPDEE